MLTTPRPARSRYAEKLTHCRFGGRSSDRRPGNRGIRFPQLLCFTFFTEIEFSVGTGCYANDPLREVAQPDEIHDRQLFSSDRNIRGSAKDLSQNTAIIPIHALMTRVQRLGNILYSPSLMTLMTWSVDFETY